MHFITVIKMVTSEIFTQMFSNCHIFQAFGWGKLLQFGNNTSEMIPQFHKYNDYEVIYEMFH